jgi:hypothetical protein
VSFEDDYGELEMHLFSELKWKWSNDRRKLASSDILIIMMSATLPWVVEEAKGVAAPTSSRDRVRLGPDRRSHEVRHTKGSKYSFLNIYGRPFGV